MPRFELSVDIQAPIARVWEAFMDMDSMGRWMGGFVAIEQLSGKAGEVDSRWRLTFDERGREVTLDETVTALCEHQEFAFRVEHDAMESETTVRFREEEGVTRIRAETEARGRGILGKAMMGLMAGQMKLRQLEDFTRFKSWVEAGQARAAAG